MSRSFFVILIFLLLLLSLQNLISNKLFLLFQKQEIKNSYKRELAALGAQSIASKDVPVASILVYGDSIIGRGFNTVNKYHLAGGHAEINAISDALSKMGIPEFKKLDRNRLVLYTTFEPCNMCRGALEEYQIRRVVFLKKKPFFVGVKAWYYQLRLDWLKRKGAEDNLQDSLFRLYPGYKG